MLKRQRLVKLLFLSILLLSGCSPLEKISSDYDISITYSSLPIPTKNRFESRTYFNNEIVAESDYISNYYNTSFIEDEFYLYNYDSIYNITPNDKKEYKKELPKTIGIDLLANDYYSEFNKIIYVTGGMESTIEIFDLDTKGISSKTTNGYWTGNYYYDGNLITGFDSSKCSHINYDVNKDEVTYIEDLNLCKLLESKYLLQDKKTGPIVFDFDTSKIEYYDSNIQLVESIEVPKRDSIEERKNNTIIPMRIYGGKNLIYISDDNRIVNFDLEKNVFTDEPLLMDISKEGFKDIHYNESEDNYYLLESNKDTCNIYDVSSSEQIASVKCYRKGLTISGIAIRKK